MEIDERFKRVEIPIPRCSEDKNGYEKARYHMIPEVQASKLLRQHNYYLKNRERILQRSSARYWAKKQKENDNRQSK